MTPFSMSELYRLARNSDTRWRRDFPCGVCITLHTVWHEICSAICRCLRHAATTDPHPIFGATITADTLDRVVCQSLCPNSYQSKLCCCNDRTASIVSHNLRTRRDYSVSTLWDPFNWSYLSLDKLSSFLLFVIFRKV